MTTLEQAVAHLAAMEDQRVRALEAARTIAGLHEDAVAAYSEASKLRDEALGAVILATAPVSAERLVKRPAAAADGLLDLDDVGGH